PMTGRWTARHCRSKPACPVPSRPGTYGTGPSSESPRRWAKGPPPSSSYTNTCRRANADNPAKSGAAGLRVFRNRAGVAVVEVLQTGSSRILDRMSGVQPEPAGPGHVHGHGHSHARGPGVINRLRHALLPHSHEAVDKVD